MNSIKPAYKSNRRNEQEARILEMRRELFQARADMLFGDRLNKEHTVEPGNMFFSQHPNFVRIFGAAIRFNKKELPKLYKKDFKLISQVLTIFG
jgi:hypothetical protein